MPELTLSEAWPGSTQSTIPKREENPAHAEGGFGPSQPSASPEVGGIRDTPYTMWDEKVDKYDDIHYQSSGDVGQATSQHHEERLRC